MTPPVTPRNGHGMTTTTRPARLYRYDDRLFPLRPHPELTCRLPSSSAEEVEAISSICRSPLSKPVFHGFFSSFRLTLVEADFAFKPVSRLTTPVSSRNFQRRRANEK